MTNTSSADQAWWLYIILCNNKSYYTGVTTDVSRRFEEHVFGNGKGAKYTRAHRRLELVYFVLLPSRSQAQRLECKIKKLPRSKKDHIVKSQMDAKAILSLIGE